MYVTRRSFAAPAPTIRDFFWLYHIYILYYAGVSIMPPWVLAQTLRGQLRGGFYNTSSGFGQKPAGAKTAQVQDDGERVVCDPVKTRYGILVYLCILSTVGE